MAWDRNERVEAQLKEKIAIIVLERLSDPRLGFLTITGVKLSRDKRHAQVLFTVLGNAAQHRTTERALHDAAPHVQKQVAASMKLRIMPELRFTYDESIEKGSRMLDLLDDLAGKRGDAPARTDGKASEPASDEARDAGEADSGGDDDDTDAGDDREGDTEGDGDNDTDADTDADTRP